MIVGLSEIRSLISLYLVQSHYRQIYLLIPSHMIASFIDATVTEWARSINLSRGWTNPALGAHASIHTIEIPEDTFLVTLSQNDG
jgi:hypothetical protein